MLVAGDLHKLLLHQCRSDRVGAFQDLAPGGSRAKRDSFGLADKTAVAAPIQNGALGVGQQNHAGGSRDGAAQNIQFIRRQVNKKYMLLLAPFQLSRLQQLQAGRLRAKKA